MSLEKLWVGNYFQKSDLVESKARAIIVDLDGTLANSDHREHLMHNGERDKYFDLVSYDSLNEWCLDLIRNYSENHMILLVTGRPERVRTDTVNWLEMHDVVYDELIMRGPDDREQGFVYKQKVLRNKLQDNYDVRLIVDNDPEICEAFRALGIPALEYQQESDGSDADAVAEISDDLADLVEAHEKGDTESVIAYHEKIDTALHGLVGEEGLRPEERK